jgi:soluble lytic murein transglycosylase-like protein
VGALRAFGAALALAATILAGAAQADAAQAGASETSPGVERWRSIAREAADRFGLPVEWVMRVIAAESGGRTRLGGELITSHAGAMGLMQIMPATWAALRAQYRLGADPHYPRDNIVAGTAYLRAMYDRFGYPGLFGAYNAGPGRYADFVERGRPLPPETRDYMARIAASARPQDRAMPPPHIARAELQMAQAYEVDPIFFSRVGTVVAVDTKPSDASGAGLPKATGAVPAPVTDATAQATSSARISDRDAIFAVRNPPPDAGE